MPQTNKNNLIYVWLLVIAATLGTMTLINIYNPANILGSTVSQTPHVSDVILTTAQCITGYENRGTLTEYQQTRTGKNICVKKTTTETPITNIKFTSPILGTQAQCETGYTERGSLLDCGSGFCAAQQKLCSTTTTNIIPTSTPTATPTSTPTTTPTSTPTATPSPQLCYTPTLVSGTTNPQTTSQGSTFTIYCDYGSQLGCIGGSSGAGACAWDGWDGTTTKAKFRCTATNTGTFNNVCSTFTGTSQNCCAQTNSGGSVTVPTSTGTPTATPTSTPNKITDIILTQEGAHQILPTCPTGYTSKFTVVDCGGANCVGNQGVCVKESSTETPAVDAYLTPENSHVVFGPGCQAGYENKGTLTDCGGGNCFGNQNLCVKKSSTEPNIIDAGRTTEGAHTTQPSCFQGYDTKGSFADCGGGTCSGSIKFCIKKTIPTDTAINIKSDLNNNCLEIYQTNQNAGANQMAVTCATGQNSQKWKYNHQTKEIKSELNSQLCLQNNINVNDPAEEGLKTTTEICNGQTNQKWTYDSNNKKIITELNQRCLHNSEVSGFPQYIKTYTCNTDISQKWTIISAV